MKKLKFLSTLFIALVIFGCQKKEASGGFEILAPLSDKVLSTSTVNFIDQNKSIEFIGKQSKSFQIHITNDNVVAMNYDKETFYFAARDERGYEINIDLILNEEITVGEYDITDPNLNYDFFMFLLKDSSTENDDEDYYNPSFNDNIDILSGKLIITKLTGDRIEGEYSFVACTDIDDEDEPDPNFPNGKYLEVIDGKFDGGIFFHQ